MTAVMRDRLLFMHDKGSGTVMYINGSKNRFQTGGSIGS